MAIQTWQNYQNAILKVERYNGQSTIHCMSAKGQRCTSGKIQKVKGQRGSYPIHRFQSQCKEYNIYGATKAFASSLGVVSSPARVCKAGVYPDSEQKGQCGDSLVPRPHPLRGKGSGDSWALSWFLQAQHFCFRASQSDCSSTIFMWYCILLRSNVVRGQLSNVTLYYSWPLTCWSQYFFPIDLWPFGTCLFCTFDLLHLQ